MIYQKNFGSVPTRIHGETNQVNQFEETQFEPLLHEYEEVCRSLFEGKYIFTMSAATVGTDGNPGRKEERSFTVRVDNTPPQILSAVLDKQSDGTVLLRVEIFDNACIQGLELFAVEFDNDGNIFNKFNMLEDYKTYLMADDVMEYFGDKDIQNLVVINPDNPSGNYIPKADLLRLIRWSAETGIKLIVDESFVDFAEEEDSTIIKQNILSENPQLFVMKSISKSYGVPGLRLGVLASGDAETIGKMKKDVAIWNINSFGEFYMQIEEKYRKDYAEALVRFREERSRFQNELAKIKGVRVIPSQANFVMRTSPETYTPSTSYHLSMIFPHIVLNACYDNVGARPLALIRFEISHVLLVVLEEILDEDGGAI